MYNCVMLKSQILLLSALAITCQQPVLAIPDQEQPVLNSVGTVPLKGSIPVEVQQQPKPEPKSGHYVGVGLGRTVEYVTFPLKHPVKCFNACTFPCRHPKMAFKEFGTRIEPYQPALNASSAIIGIGTGIGSVVLLGSKKFGK